MATPTPFKISVPDSALELINNKLDLTTWPDELSEAEWAPGVPLAAMKRLAHHWRHTYSWRDAEARINRDLPQFTTPIAVDGFGALDIHFVHARSTRPSAVPLLFCHGWPGHFLEVSKLLPLLTSPDNSDSPTFHVVAPSLPNFGFSAGVSARGFSLAQYAEVCHKLMQALGYEQYVTQGGDWGYAVTRWMAMRYSGSVRACHSNMPGALPPSLTSAPLVALRFYTQYLLVGLSAPDKRGVERLQRQIKDGAGYMAVQSTKPQTIAYSQADSPVALLAWIYEKLHDWTDEYPWTDDELLTWVCVYAFSRAGPGAANRIYYEVAHDEDGRGKAFSTYTPGVKLGFSRFPAEIGGVPRIWLDALGEVVHWREMDKGGHFAAYEVPEALAGELTAMFGKGGGAYNCIEGKDGY